MNIVPVSGPNTLPVIYDRGLIGVMHDWYISHEFVLLNKNIWDSCLSQAHSFIICTNKSLVIFSKIYVLVFIVIFTVQCFRYLICTLFIRCEPFDTYPRTYDLLHAAGLFSIERKR